MFRGLSAAALCLALAGCASTDLGVRQVGETPTDKSNYKAGIWEVVAQYEEDMKISGARVTDAALTAYVEDLVCKLAEEHCLDIRVYIIDHPQFNALMAPNGMMIVHTGLLLRAESEAELAFILSHEIAHFIEQHTFEQYGRLKNSVQASAFLTASFGDLLVFGSVAQFSRDQEAEADELGLARMRAHGYSSDAAVALWEDLTAEVEASDNKRKKRNYNRVGYLGTHPAPLDRIEMLRNMSDDTEDAEDGKVEYRKIIRGHLFAWLENNIAQRDFGSSLYLINQLADLEEDLGVLEYMRGEVYRIRSEDGDRDQALKSYEAALTYEDAPAYAWRQVGDRYHSQGDMEAAHDAFSTYLAHMPDAMDRKLVEGLMKTMEAKSK